MKKPSIQDLFPNLTQEELVIAEHTPDQYLALIVRIADRIIEEKGYDEFVRMLDDAKAEGRRPIERSKLRSD